jgi:hypothetical protein
MATNTRRNFTILSKVLVNDESAKPISGGGEWWQTRNKKEEENRNFITQYSPNLEYSQKYWQTTRAPVSGSGGQGREANRNFITQNSPNLEYSQKYW